MAKKVKFPLDMGNEVYVRTLEELKENYNSEKVTEYFLDSRLLTWLNDRYFDDEAEQVQELMEQEDKNNLAAKLGKIFGVEIESEEVDIEALEIRREKLDKLRRITSDDNILENVDSVAFSQEELGDLLDEEKDVIYLCGEKFRIPLNVENVRYIGVNNPVVSIGGKGEIDLEASGIVIVECIFSEDTKARLKVKENKNEYKEEKKEIEEIKENEKKHIINRNPLRITKGEEAEIVNLLAEAFLDNPAPYAAAQLTHQMFNDCDRIVLSGEYINFSQSKVNHKFAKVVYNQNKYVEKAIEKHGHILCCTEDNKSALASGCLFRVDAEGHRYMSYVGCGFLQIYIKPEKYAEFIEKFAVTPLLVGYFSNNADHNTIERLITKGRKAALKRIVPYIHLNMCKFVDDICEQFGRPIGTLEKNYGSFDLGDYGVYHLYADYIKLADFEYQYCSETTEDFEKDIYQKAVLADFIDY